QPRRSPAPERRHDDLRGSPHEGGATDELKPPMFGFNRLTCYRGLRPRPAGASALRLRLRGPQWTPSSMLDGVHFGSERGPTPAGPSGPGYGSSQARRVTLGRKV